MADVAISRREYQERQLGRREDERADDAVLQRVPGISVAAGSIATDSDVALSGLAVGDTLQWNGSAWVNVPGGGSGITRTRANIAVNTAAGATASVDYLYNATVAGITLTLPTAVGNNNSYTYKNSSAGNVNLASTAAETFDGTASPIALAPGQSLQLVSDGANWTIN